MIFHSFPHKRGPIKKSWFGRPDIFRLGNLLKLSVLVQRADALQHNTEALLVAAIREIYGDQYPTIAAFDARRGLTHEEVREVVKLARERI